MRQLFDSGATVKVTGERAPKDSAVTMYWDPRPLQPTNGKEDPSKQRLVGFAYGLGSVASEQGGHLLLSMSSRVVEGQEFTLSAVVNDPAPGERLTANLPSDMKLVAGSDLTQDVPQAQEIDKKRRSSVTWKLKAGKPGPFEITVTSSNGAKVTIKGKVNRARDIFD